MKRLFGSPSWQMEARPEFGLPERGFAIIVSLKEGYGTDGKVHTVAEVQELVDRFPAEIGVEFGAEVLGDRSIMYSYYSGGELVRCTEPSVRVEGLFPPNKFGDWEEHRLVELIAELSARLAALLRQVSIHAVVCGKHHSWKRAGQLTAHEEGKDTR